jgi:DNA primase catalytic core
MKNVKSYLGNILDNLNRAEALPELNPKEQGRYVSLTCPSCHQQTAYISQRGYYIYCNRKNHCGYIKGIVEYITERDRVSEEDAIRTLAKITRTQLPELTEEERVEYNKLRERQRLYKDILSIAKSGLWEYGGSVVEYLRGRGYEDTEIMHMDFGSLPMVSKLKELLTKKGHNYSLVEGTLSSFNQEHPLLIPVYDPFGALDGFITRAIEPNITPKYLYSKGLERGAYFFNFNEAKRENTLVIVEGVIDALLLTQRGIRGAVACGGNIPTESQINNALKYGKVKNIILCLDNDDAGRKGTERAIELLKDKNINIYIANTDPYKDPDELIKSKSIEDFKEVLNRAENWGKWTAKRIISKFDITTDIGREGALNDLLELEDGITDPIEAEYIINTITETLGYSREVIQDKVLTFHEKRAKEKEAEAYKLLLKEALKLERENKFEELEKLLTDGIAKTRAIVTSNIITPYPTEKAKEDIQNRRLGLETGYPSIDKFVTIPNGAITLIAGRPSHGKTTFLLNLMLNMIEKNPDKSFYFFSYEESKTALYVKIINILSGTIVSSGLEYKNTQQLEYYIKSNSNKIPKINDAIATYDNYVKAGRLYLVDNPLDVDVLAGTLENATYNYDVGGVFIDYAQRVKYSGKYETERVKIARISEILRETATRLDIPLIIGAQLNRENSKDKPQLDNLKEAGNLEEDANVVLGLYNWKTAIEKEKANEIITKEGETKKKTLKNCKGGNVKIDYRAIDFEVHILKNRNGAINETALLSFDAPVLKIKDTEPKIKDIKETPF